MLRVSGHDSSYALWEFWRPDCGVSRIDLQLTTWPLKHGPGYFIKREFARMREARTTGRTKTKKLRFYMDEECGATVEIGSPKSDFRLKMYDKGVQTKKEHYAGAVRYELQMRHDLSKAVAARLVKTGQRALWRAIRDTVIHECRWRGIEPLEGAGEDYAVDTIMVREETDTERRLAWLRSQVSPSIYRLAAAGKLLEALEAIGLWQYDRGEINLALDIMRDTMYSGERVVEDQEYGDDVR